MSEQRAVYPPSRTQSNSDRQKAVETEEEEETKTFLFQYLSSRVRVDKDVPISDAEVIEEHGQRAVRSCRTEGGGQAVIVGTRLAELGDEIDAQYEEEIKEIIELSGTPETAFSIFSDVVKNLFEWDSQDGAKINMGRIAALMAYCYHLVKAFILQRVGSSGVIFSFMCLIAGWLFKVFIKAKFYQWLHNQGGWGQLLVSATGFNFTGMGRNFFLLAGIASLTIWAISYFRGSS